jgi:hypothetical protein
MALHVNLDHQGRVYFALSCDGCGAVFTCYDDGCYSFASLRTEAVFAGWDAGQRPEQTHRCPSCLTTGTTTGTTAGPASVRPSSSHGCWSSVHGRSRDSCDGPGEASSGSASVVDRDAGRATSHEQGDLDDCGQQLRERAAAGVRKSLLAKEFGVGRETVYSYLRPAAATG